MKRDKYAEYRNNRDVISLFSGAMGLDIGLTNAGLNVALGQDFEKSCVETMKANGHAVLGGDIRDIEPCQLLELANLSVGETFLLCGGPPCQPFSTAGKRLGINDPRGSLFMDFIRMIDYIQPRFFIMENVKGLMSAPLKHVPISERNDSDSCLSEAGMRRIFSFPFQRIFRCIKMQIIAGKQWVRPLKIWKTMPENVLL